MTSPIVEELMRLVPVLVKFPEHIDASYDEGADVLYVNFAPGIAADDSELTGGDVLLRYKDERLIGVTVMNASKRSSV